MEDDYLEESELIQAGFAKISMRRKTILSGLAYFFLLMLAVSVASPSFFRLLERDRPVTVSPTASFYLPHVRHAAISPGGDRIAVATTSGVEIRDMAGGELQVRLGYGRVDGVAWSPDGRLVAAINDEAISVWEPGRDGGREMCSIPHPHVESRWFPDSSRIATISREQECVIIWDVLRDKLIHRIRGPDNYRVCDTVAVSNSTIATAWSREEDKRAVITLWDAESYEEIRHREVSTLSWCYSGRQSVYKMVWSPNGTVLSYLLAYCPGTRHEWFTLELWPTSPPSGETFSPTIETGDEGLWISSYSWSPSGNSIAMVFNMSNNLGIYDFTDRTFRHGVLEDEVVATGSYNRVAGFTPDGNRLGVAMHLQNTVRIFDLESLDTILEIDEYGMSIYDGDLSPDGDHLVLLDMDYSVKLIELDSGDVSRIFDVRQNLGGGLRFSGDGKRVFVWTDESVSIWNLERGDFDANWSIPESVDDGEGISTGDHPWKVSRISPDSSSVAVIRVGSDRRIRTIEIRDSYTGELVRSRDVTISVGDMGNSMGGFIIDWSPGQELIVFTDYNGLYIWNLADDDIWKLGTHENISSFAFHPHKDVLASTGSNGETVLWNLTRGTRIISLDQALYGIIYSFDGSMILGDSGIFNSTTLEQIYSLESREPSMGMVWDRSGRVVVTFAPFDGPIDIYVLPR